ncbi:DUF2268 domain-containing putative Zn-dependent protease [uncultured Thermanaerothrix sp.]|uniref:DUF2268 domain-containing putative Zn-dependent protease n=1 Tax=uncultured Thermanaerothrix sp. TaxID=1195149 RepID=UPI00261D58CE|nr:DUF2268 domain-containing putative Zn-dependent protease [uncultured Thermanaerothrix sp.]
MLIIDLTKHYIRHVIQHNDIARYESAFPELFQHYHTFWAPLQAYSFRDAEEIARRRDFVIGRLPLLSKRFEEKGLNVTNIDIVLLVGHGTSNGHAFPLTTRWIVWLPLETYHSPQAVDVFVSHEIAHALHYQQQPAFYFRNEYEKNKVFRQLVTEGIATFISKEVLSISNEQALWADYLPFDRVQQWYEACLEREEEIFRVLADELDCSDRRNRLFSFSETDNVLENRAGYYAGLILIERYVKQQCLTLQDLLGTSEKRFWQIIQISLGRNEPI